MRNPFPADKQPRCVIYARYPHPAKTINEQLAELELQAERRGLKVAATYFDSSNRAPRRGNPPGLVEILERAQQKKDFQTLLLTDLGRLADVDAGTSIARNFVELADLGVEIVIADYPTLTSKSRLNLHEMFKLLTHCKRLTAPKPSATKSNRATWDREEFKRLMKQGKTLDQISKALRLPKWTAYRRMLEVRTEA